MKGSWVRPHVAPPIARPVVCAHAREARDARLDEAPLDGEVSDSGLEDDGRRRRARAAETVEVESPSADLHELSRRGKRRSAVRLRVNDIRRAADTRDEDRARHSAG